MDEPNSMLEVRGLKKYYPITKGFFRRNVGTVKAVDGVSLTIAKGEALGLVGESGCGKTTLGRCIVRAMDPTGGTIRLHIDGRTVEFSQLSEGGLRPFRRHVSMVFQDPYASLNPRMTVLDIVGEPLKLNGIAERRQLEDRVSALLETVGLEPAHLKRYPHAFSGGQRQRIGIARALATEPQLVICDEAVSALDVSIQAQILNLILDLQRKFGLTYLFIAHDLTVVRHVSDRVGVMYVGKLVEMAATLDIFDRPLHPYTEALLSAVPDADPDLKRARVRLQGEVANPAAVPSGCPFHPRCRYAQSRCTTDVPEFREVGPTRFVACHFAEELSLHGVGDA